MVKGDSDPIGSIKGITPEAKEKFLAEGIKNTIQLLEIARTPQQRAELAKKFEITQNDLKELVNRADLMRLKGVGGDLANLLEEAGVNTIRELQHRTPESLYKKLEEVQSSRKLAHHLPKAAQVTAWVEEAKLLAEDSPV